MFKVNPESFNTTPLLWAIPAVAAVILMNLKEPWKSRILGWLQAVVDGTKARVAGLFAGRKSNTFDGVSTAELGDAFFNRVKRDRENLRRVNELMQYYKETEKPASP